MPLLLNYVNNFSTYELLHHLITTTLTPLIYIVSPDLYQQVSRLNVPCYHSFGLCVLVMYKYNENSTIA